MNSSTRHAAAGICLGTFGLLILACGSVDPEPEAAFVSLVEAERAFARSAAAIGARDAFLAFLADDAILFRPRATNGKEFLATQPASAGLLAWEPAYADVSRGGDLGFTTGPWLYRPEPAAAATAAGQYFTVWKLQPDDTWKVAIDHGTFNQVPAEPLAPSTSPTVERPERRGVAREIDGAMEIERLLQEDRAFASAVATQGLSKAIDDFFTDDVRTLRNGIQPRTGIDAARADAAQTSGRLAWQVLGGDIARSGDLGYTYGEYVYEPSEASNPKELGNYVRVWRYEPGSDRVWRVAVDVVVPLPRPPAED